MTVTVAVVGNGRRGVCGDSHLFGRCRRLSVGRCGDGVWSLRQDLCRLDP